MRCIVIILIIIIARGNLESQILPLPELKFEDEVEINSRLNKESKLQGFNLINISSEDCDHDKYWEVLPRLKERIIEMEVNEDTLNIVIGTIAECCRKFLGEIEIRNDTINLLYTEHGNVCECVCYYHIRYQVLISKEKFKASIYQFMLKNEEVEITDEKYKTYPIKYDIYYGDTINLVDKYGMNQGYWIQKDSFERVKLEGYFKNDKDKYYGGRYSGFIGRADIVYYGESKKIKTENFRVGYELLIRRDFYKSGNLRRECILNYKVDNHFCRELDEEGNVTTKER